MADGELRADPESAEPSVGMLLPDVAHPSACKMCAKNARVSRLLRTGDYPGSPAFLQAKCGDGKPWLILS